MNTTTLTGNITRDPELKFSQSGVASCRLGIAVSKRWLDKKSGEWEEKTSFFNIVCFGQLAENVTNSLGKGAEIIVQGEFQTREYEVEGAKRTATELTASFIGASLTRATVSIEKNPPRSTEWQKEAKQSAPRHYEEEAF